MNAQQVFDMAVNQAKALHAIKPLVEQIMDDPVSAAYKMLRMEARIRELEGNDDNS